MHWFPILLLAALTLAGQTIVAPRLEVQGARPDFLLPLVLFFGWNSPPHRAILFGWTLGFFADLMSVERMGLLSLTYGMTALLLTSLREYLFRSGLVMQFVVALVFGLLIRAGWTMYVQVLYGASAGTLRRTVLAATYTALITPIVFGMLGWCAPLFGSPRRSSDARRGTMSLSHV